MGEVILVDDKLTIDFIFGSFCIIYCIVVFGVVSNIINLIIFIRHGLKDTVNISLTALAVCDICSLLPLILTGVLSQPQLLPPDVNFVGSEIQFLTASWPHSIFTRLTSWITAFIMFERCLCIAQPLKVKTLLTPYRVKLCLALISLVVIAGVLPTYLTHSFDWKFYPHVNKTLLGLILTDNALDVTHISNTLNNPVSALMSFGITAVSTVVIVIHLKRKSRQRHLMTGTNKSDRSLLSSKDHKAVKMVVALSAIFLISVIPSIVVVIGSVIDDEFGIFGRYKNIFNIAYSVTFIMEALNSSVGIVVYYFMNSRYKKTFRDMLLSHCNLQKALN